MATTQEAAVSKFIEHEWECAHAVAEKFDPANAVCFFKTCSAMRDFKVAVTKTQSEMLQDIGSAYLSRLDELGLPQAGYNRPVANPTFRAEAV